MKLIIFLDKETSLSDEEKTELAKLSSGNLYGQLTDDEKLKLDDDEESFLAGVFVETSIRSEEKKPIVFNYYKIDRTPSIIFLSENEMVYHWESIVTLSEIVKSMVSYFRILKMSSMDYDYDPEE